MLEFLLFLLSCEIRTSHCCTSDSCWRLICLTLTMSITMRMSALCFVSITHRPPHSSVHHWRSSIPGRRLPCLEQSATARYVCILIACLPQPPQDSPSFGAVSHNIFLSCIVPAQWQCYSDTIIDYCYCYVFGYNQHTCLCDFFSLLVSLACRNDCLTIKFIHYLLSSIPVPQANNHVDSTIGLCGASKQCFWAELNTVLNLPL